jgi:hyaluronan synthase
MKKVLNILSAELKANYSTYIYIYLLFVAIIFIVNYKIQSTSRSSFSDVFYLYSVLTLSVMLVKYVGSIFHPTNRWSKYRPYKWPEIDIIIPGFNEGGAVYETVKSVVAANYPKERMNIVLIDDGSTDDTWKHMRRAQKDFSKRNIVTIRFKENKGKKEAMAAGFRKTSGKYVIFIDSDSKIDKNCLKELVRPYKKSDKIGAVSGHALVWNHDGNLLTKMQEVRYFNAFRSAKATESLFGFVSCCPGCCSSYERESMEKVLEPWLQQSFLGAKCTYGDDRSLTNCILKLGKDTVYNEMAIAHTIVPENIKKFIKQQLRWKKSWARESIVVMSFAWKRNPFVGTLMMLDIITPFFAPIVIMQIFFWHIFVNPISFMTYLIGVTIFASCLGLFYKIHNKDRSRWLQSALYSSLLSVLLFWQLPYALLTLKDTKWGTR